MNRANVRITQDLVTSLTQHLLERGAENYIEDHYMIVLEGSEPTTAVITVQYTDKPSAHDFRVKAEAERNAVLAECERLREALEVIADNSEDRSAADYAKGALSRSKDAP